MSSTEALHDHLMEMVDSDDYLIDHGSVKFNLFEHAFSLSVGALRDSKKDKWLISKQEVHVKTLRKALSDISECGFIPHHSKIIVDIALETTKSEL